MQAANRNLLWSKIFVDELARSGLKAVCIAPGSRSTPLAIAFAEHGAIQVYSIIDERSAAFFALGLALASDAPVALLCSSGTATANFHPAIIEAYYSRVPLLVLTADRPPELRESGANQTIDQVKMYGDHVLWAVDAALPEAQPAALTLRSLRTLANRAFATANGLPKGPVHLNFPFRKPLEPIPVPTDMTEVEEPRPTGIPFTAISRGVMVPRTEQLDNLARIIRGAKRGLIVCGTRCPGGDFPAAVEQLAEHLNFALLADPLSGVRYSADLSAAISTYDTFLRFAKGWESPDVVLHFGDMPTSQALDDMLNASTPEHRIAITADGTWHDANHRIDALIWADPVLVCGGLMKRIDDEQRMEQADGEWFRRFLSADRVTTRIIGEALEAGEYFDGAVLNDVVDLLPDNAMLYIASSLPVRHLDQFGIGQTKNIRTFGNRGASGIDGTISSALGAAASSDQPTVLVAGDLAFYHDMNGLLTAKRHNLKLTIVLLNNNGGGIFYRLPVAQFEPPFTDLFLTPHGLEFEHAARLYGLDYTQAHDRETFRRCFEAALQSDQSGIIEVPTQITRDDARRREIMERVSNELKAI